MIEDVKNILNKLIEKSNEIDFVSYTKFSNIEDGIESYLYGVRYKFKDMKFDICPTYYTQKAIIIEKDHNFIKRIECSNEDYLEILLLLSKLNKIYTDRTFNEFKHSLDI